VLARLLACAVTLACLLACFVGGSWLCLLAVAGLASRCGCLAGCCLPLRFSSGPRPSCLESLPVCSASRSWLRTLVAVAVLVACRLLTLFVGAMVAQSTSRRSVFAGLALERGRRRLPKWPRRCARLHVYSAGTWDLGAVGTSSFGRQCQQKILALLCCQHIYLAPNATFIVQLRLADIQDSSFLGIENIAPALHVGEQPRIRLGFNLGLSICSFGALAGSSKFYQLVLYVWFIVGSVFAIVLLCLLCVCSVLVKCLLLVG
jgi:hypothetical protein